MKITCSVLLLVLLSSLSFSKTALPQQSSDVTATIGDFDRSYITVTEYCAFLNSVATKSDAHFLYNEKMGSDIMVAPIFRTGTPGAYVYSVSKDLKDFPVTYVDLFSEMRFCNWVENGAPLNINLGQEDAVTESGTYQLNAEETVGEVTAEADSNAIWTLDSDSISHGGGDPFLGSNQISFNIKQANDYIGVPTRMQKEEILDLIALTQGFVGGLGGFITSRFLLILAGWTGIFLSVGVVTASTLAARSSSLSAMGKIEGTTNNQLERYPKSVVIALLLAVLLVEVFGTPMGMVTARSFSLERCVVQIRDVAQWVIHSSDEEITDFIKKTTWRSLLGSLIISCGGGISAEDSYDWVSSKVQKLIKGNLNYSSPPSMTLTPSQQALR